MTYGKNKRNLILLVSVCLPRRNQWFNNYCVLNSKVKLCKRREMDTNVFGQISYLKKIIRNFSHFLCFKILWETFTFIYLPIVHCINSSSTICVTYYRLIYTKTVRIILVPQWSHIYVGKLSWEGSARAMNILCNNWYLTFKLIIFNRINTNADENSFSLWLLGNYLAF